MVEIPLQTSLSPIPAECIVRQCLRKYTEAVEHRGDTDDDEAGREEPSRGPLRMDLRVPDGADGDDDHVERVEQVPTVDQPVTGDPDHDHDGKQHRRKTKTAERMLHFHESSSQPAPPGPSRPGFVILPRSRTLFSSFSPTPLARASCRMDFPVRIDSLASLAASS